MVYGPRYSPLILLYNKDGTAILKSLDDIEKKWAEHFEDLLNTSNEVKFNVINHLVQNHIHWSIDQTPTWNGVEHAISQLKIGKGPSPSGIPPEIFQYGRQETAKQIHGILINIWISNCMHPDLKNVDIV